MSEAAATPQLTFTEAQQDLARGLSFLAPIIKAERAAREILASVGDPVALSNQMTVMAREIEGQKVMLEELLATRDLIDAEIKDRRRALDEEIAERRRSAEAQHRAIVENMAADLQKATRDKEEEMRAVIASYETEIDRDKARLADLKRQIDKLESLREEMRAAAR